MGCPVTGVGEKTRSGPAPPGGRWTLGDPPWCRGDDGRAGLEEEQWESGLQPPWGQGRGLGHVRGNHQAKGTRGPCTRGEDKAG